MEELTQVVEQSFSALIQLGIDLGIPFDNVPTNPGETAYLQACLQWAIFVLSSGFGFINGFARSCMGGVR